MSRFCIVYWFVLVALVAAPCGAADVVKLKEKGKSISGKLVEMSPTEVTIEQNSAPRKIPVHQIELINYDEEPAGLADARRKSASGDFETALARLKKIKTADITRREIAQDVEYYSALAAAKLALGGKGSLADARTKLMDFGKANAGSYHFLELCEVLGDIHVALGEAEKAQTFYAKLAASAAPEQKVRAAVAVGRSLAAEEKYAEAIAKFDEVLSAPPSDATASGQLAAQLGKADALAHTGQLDEAVKLVEEVIAKADPEEWELHARAYNTLGNCYLAAGQKKEAFHAFLHVDVLYPGFPAQHAEALGNLATLWLEVYNKNDKAEEARSSLKQRYPNSRWAAAK